MKIIIDIEILDNGDFISTVSKNSEKFPFLFYEMFKGYGDTPMSALLDTSEKIALYESDLELFKEHGDNIK